MIESWDRSTLDQAIARLADSAKPERSDLSSEVRPRSQEWDLNTGFKEARELAIAGWQEKARELWQLVRALAPAVEYGLKSAYDVTGECVDVGRFLNGEPECMLSHQVPVKNVIKVAVNISARCNAPANLLFNRGAALAAIVQALQSAGQSVSLSVVEVVSSEFASGSMHETIVEIERFGDYINPGRLAFWLAHPAALRRCIFRLNEQSDASIRQTYGFHDDGGYGYPQDHPSKMKEEDVVYIPFPETDMLGDYANPNKALRSLITFFTKAGVPISARAEEGKG
jgi:hypothetical protein